MEHLEKKYGPSATRRFGDPNSSLRQSGRAVGIEFTNDRNIYPTIKAHTLVEYLKENNKNDAANDLMEDLYKRYFENGENINDSALLAEVASKHEVPKEVMADEERRDGVLYKDRNWKQGGVSGVPFFIIEQNKGGRPVAFSGAQPSDIIAECLQDAAEE